MPRLISASASSFSHPPSCTTKLTNSPLGNRQSATGSKSETGKGSLKLWIEIWNALQETVLGLFLLSDAMANYLQTSQVPRNCTQQKQTITLLRVIPTMTFHNSHVRFYVILIGSGEGRHTTHLLKCVLYLSTSQTDWKQSSDILSDISFEILSDISSDISSDILSDRSFDILSDISSDMSSDILSDISFDILSDISSDILSDISF